MWCHCVPTVAVGIATQNTFLFFMNLKKITGWAGSPSVAG